MIPERLRGYMANTALLAPPMHFMEPIGFDLGELRRAVRQQIKVHFRYTDVLAKAASGRCGRCRWPISGPVWVLAAWCELRDRLPHLPARPHRGFAVTPERFRPEPGKTLHDFLKRAHLDAERARPRPRGGLTDGEPDERDTGDVPRP